MTNAKISNTARMVLRNKTLSSAIAHALVNNPNAATRDGFVVTVDGKTYRVKIASSLTAKDILNASK